MNATLAAAAFAVALAAGSAETLPTPELEGGIPAAIQTAPVKGVLSDRHRTVVGVTVGKHSLDGVMNILGRAAVVKLERAEGRPSVVCFRSGDPSDDTVVMFEAGPLGGFKQVTAISVGPSSTFGAIQGSCKASKAISREAANAGGISLGIAVEMVAQSVGSPIANTSAGLFEVAFEKTETIKESSSGKAWEVDTSSGLVGRARGGLVSWFSVYYTRSR